MNTVVPDPCRTLDVLDREVRALRALMEARIASVEATAAALKDTIDHKFAQANEWREQSADRERAHAQERTNYVTRRDLDIQVQARMREIAALGQRIDENAGWRLQLTGALTLLYLIAAVFGGFVIQAFRD